MIFLAWYGTIFLDLIKRNEVQAATAIISFSFFFASLQKVLHTLAHCEICGKIIEVGLVQAAFQLVWCSCDHEGLN